ncbi:GtrA family protein [Clostridium yunnanense]|nr:GtrA family protein [Clostridium yunnanense]
MGDKFKAIMSLKVINIFFCGDEMKEMLRFIRFGIVGVMNTLITIIAFWILGKFGINYILANTLSYLIGVVNSYFLNSKWVFKVNAKNSERSVKFVIINLIVLAINNCLLILFVSKFSLDKHVAQILVIGICMVLNYFLNKKWTFSEEIKNR